MDMESKIRLLSDSVADPAGLDTFTDAYQALLAELRAAMETGSIPAPECARLALLLRHLCVGRVAFLVAARQRLAAEAAARN